MPKERRKLSDAAPGNSSAPSHEDISRRAHEIWLERGSEPGHELDHWLEAEQELAGGKRRGRADSRERSVTP